jgi:hypothetical protein
MSCVECKTSDTLEGVRRLLELFLQLVQQRQRFNRCKSIHIGLFETIDDLLRERGKYGKLHRRIFRLVAQLLRSWSFLSFVLN